jgi:hypothetical protein
MLLLAGFVRILPALIRVPDSYDFAAYYVAARVLNAGEPLYDTSLMIAAATSDGQTIAFPAYIYPPFLAALLRPIAVLPFGIAKTLWFGFNLVCLFVSLWLLTRLIGLSWRTLLPIGLIALVIPAIYDTLLLGQVNLLLLILISGSVCLSSRPTSLPREIAAGLLLGIAVAIKLFPIVIGFSYIVRRRFVALASMLGGMLAMLIVGIVVGNGPENTFRYYTQVLPGFAGGTNNPGEQSIWPIMGRLFSLNTFNFAFLTTENHTTVIVHPILNAPIAGSILALVGAICITLITVLSLIRSSPDNQAIPALPEYSLMIVLILLTFPIVHDHYLSLLCIPIFYIIQRYRQEQRATTTHWLRSVLILCGLLVALQRYWRVLITRIPSPLLLIFGFTALMLLWLTLLQLVNRSSQQASGARDPQRIHDLP